MVNNDVFLSTFRTYFVYLSHAFEKQKGYVAIIASCCTVTDSVSEILFIAKPLIHTSIWCWLSHLLMLFPFFKVMSPFVLVVGINISQY